MFPKTRLCSLHSTNVNWDAIVFNAFKSDLSFYENRNDWISFRPINLNAKNQNLINLMLSVQSIVIHVRRGDFCRLNIVIYWLTLLLLVIIKKQLN